MNDLISRQAAIGIIQGLYPGMPRVPWLRKDWQERYEPYINAEKAIRTLPSAQPEIIYCKDCIHAIEDALCGGYWCKGKAVTSNHYCGYAERRTDGRD